MKTKKKTTNELLEEILHKLNEIHSSMKYQVTYTNNPPVTIPFQYPQTGGSGTTSCPFCKLPGCIGHAFC